MSIVEIIISGAFIIGALLMLIGIPMKSNKPGLVGLIIIVLCVVVIIILAVSGDLKFL